MVFWRDGASAIARSDWRRRWWGGENLRQMILTKFCLRLSFQIWRWIRSSLSCSVPFIVLSWARTFSLSLYHAHTRTYTRHTSICEQYVFLQEQLSRVYNSCCLLGTVFTFIIHAYRIQCLGDCHYWLISNVCPQWCWLCCFVEMLYQRHTPALFHHQLEDQNHASCTNNFQVVSHSSTVLAQCLTLVLKWEIGLPAWQGRRLSL